MSGTNSLTKETPVCRSEYKNRFVSRHSEKEEFNQYWYSPHTIETLVQELEAVATRVAFVSTPSVYFSLKKGSKLRSNSWVFDYDQQWAHDPQFVFYDFRKPEDVPKDLWHTFDCVVVDPPFVTKEVWEKYVTTAKLLSRPGGKVILSTIPENDTLLCELIGVEACAFKPSIPNLVYQYNFFTNYESRFLGQLNPEIAVESGF